ncbi:hypothetical protein HDV06_004331 [Boothiomyces sp. JEL0866]|nr:hypothetical protein HDV06_004331 [Boothiomyces sp. JEL0866]
MVGKKQVLQLYKSFLKSGRLYDYTFKSYVHRRVRDAFKASAKETNPDTVKLLYEHGLDELVVVKRQGQIQSQFKSFEMVSQVNIDGIKGENFHQLRSDRI